MTFTFQKAVREQVGLIIGISGPSGSGKSMSAMRLAKGIVGPGNRFAVIDTEARRALHYAEMFDFDHLDLRPPFRPSRYIEAVEAADKAGYKAIVIDSGSHIWSGEGGVLDWQEAELERMAGNDWAKRERVKMAAWIKPKMEYKHFVQRMLQVRAHLIIALRAEQKVDIVKDAQGKNQIVPRGFQPICARDFPFELTVSFMLLPERPGYPNPIKLQEQHQKLFPLDRPIDEEAGRRIAEWAAGGAPAPKREKVSKQQEPPDAAPIAPAPEPPAAEAGDPEAGAPAGDPVDQRAFPLDTVVLMKPHGHDPSHTPWKFSLPSEADDFLIAWSGEFDGRVAEKDSIGLQALWQSNAAMLKAVEQGAPDIYRQVAKLKDAAKARLGVTEQRRRG